jgi:hypothetical protein
MSETIVKDDHTSDLYTTTTQQPSAPSAEPGQLRRVFRAVRNIVNEMNYGTERMTKRQAPWW